MQATATHWVTQDKELIAVTDMSTTHLLRWVRYFRNKVRADYDDLSAGHLDVIVRSRMITGEAIYRELRQRGYDLSLQPEGLDAMLTAAIAAASNVTFTPIAAASNVTFTPGGAALNASNVTFTPGGAWEMPTGAKARKKKLAREHRQQKADERERAKLQVAFPSGRRKIRVD